MESEIVGAPRGYVSEDGKRSFTLIAGILGAVFFIAQFLLPFIVMMTCMPAVGFVSGFEMKECLIDRASFWNGKVWYISEISSTAPRAGQNCNHELWCFVPGAKKNEKISVLNLTNPWLLPDSDRLWIISCDSVGFFRDNQLVVLNASETLGDISRPFLYRGKPAVIEERPGGLRIRILNNNIWETGEPVSIETGEDDASVIQDIQVLSLSDKLHFFYKYGNTLYYRDTFPEAEEDWNEWQPVAVVSRWTSFSCDGAPALLYNERQNSSDNCVKAARLSGGSWVTYFSKEMFGVSDLGACGLSEKEGSMLLLSSFPMSFHAVEVRGSTVKSDYRLGEQTPFPKGLLTVIGLSYGGIFLMPVILAFILTSVMEKYRITTISLSSNVTVRQAPLSKRALSQIVDGILMCAPLVVGYTTLFTDFERMMNPSSFFKSFGLVIGGLIWGFILFLIFSFLEGKWGITPGKWLFGIRVTGLDLEPCGLGRALIRNLLKLVDGFFNFIVGIMMVALTENWQRLGDYAARTIVIEAKKSEGRSGDGNQYSG